MSSSIRLHPELLQMNKINMNSDNSIHLLRPMTMRKLRLGHFCHLKSLVYMNSLSLSATKLCKDYPHSNGLESPQKIYTFEILKFLNHNHALYLTIHNTVTVHIK
jgi:hypothetical protein